ncbi:uncharacterized protein BO80DRAFT_229445 [Aspergillus ibericus CBS 121593]|uniref:Uncharacterized protein n=1 Tax=Aspergillus ibericus CBS 121593 TaxID=1448316 RepID=A0A395GN88_9EURO|nr:hypothetical protein BO80DRAFT_229445 [Aspergillus ibericus CBS 121593]RAK96297.1 hypothetical protein BO80DRAFT_229445 [Aspergillus ibericus CBS 121593]
MQIAPTRILAVFKPHAGRLVVGWITTSESLLLYVLILFFSCFLFLITIVPSGYGCLLGMTLVYCVPVYMIAAGMALCYGIIFYPPLSRLNVFVYIDHPLLLL